VSVEVAARSVVVLSGARAGVSARICVSRSETPAAMALVSPRAQRVRADVPGPAPAFAILATIGTRPFGRRGRLRSGGG
jgi:hypothetical protein